MKKFKFLLLALLLSSCGLTNVNSTSFNDSSLSNTSQSTSSINDITSLSSDISSSSIISSGSSLEEEIKETNIKEIKEIANKYKGLENNVGVYESNEQVEIELKLIACLDAITSKTGYGDRYKILMTDGKDYIYLKTTLEIYTNLKKYVEDRGVYNVKGNISLYNNEVEITVREEPKYLQGKDFEFDYNDLATQVTLKQFYEEINNLKLNCKGIAFSKIVSMDVICLAKDINNTNLYFGNGEYIINVHGNDKVTNKFVKGASYNLIGALNMHNFRPGLEYVYAEKLDVDIKFDVSNASEMKASDFYNYKYEVDEDESYPNYTQLFEKPYKIKGYVNSYMKDNKEYVVFEDQYNENYYSTYQNALNAKTVFFVNENYIKLTSSNSKYCPLYEHIENGTYLEITLFPYMWNTLKYPQVYAYEFIEI